MKTRNILKTVVVILAVLFVLGYCIFKLVASRAKYAASEKIYDNAAQIFTAPQAASDGTNKEGNNPGENSINIADELTAPLAVDFEALRAENSDIVGWIYCEDTPLDYPVLQGESNSTYLKTAYNGVYDFSGSIFLDCSNNPDLTDPQTIIYGHNMQNGRMFACLEKYRKQEFFDEHNQIWLITPKRTYLLHPTACVMTSANPSGFNYYKRAGNDCWQKNIEEIWRNASAKNEALDIAESTMMVMLSTCAYDYTNARCVLLCVVE